MPTHVQLPDGNIGEFPDGMGHSQIEAVLAKQFPSPSNIDMSKVAGATPGMKFAAPSTPSLPSPSLLDPVPNHTNSMATGTRNLAAGFAQGAIGVVKHPIDTAASILQSAPAVSSNGYGGVASTGNQQLDDQNNAVLRGFNSPQVQQGRQAIQQIQANPAHAVGSMAGQAAIMAALGGVARTVAPKLSGIVAPEANMEGENFTKTHAAADAGILARGTAMGKNFIPKQVSADSLGEVRNVAANPANKGIVQAILKGEPENALAGVQNLTQQALDGLETRTRSILQPHANLPADVSSIKQAISQSLPQSLDDFAAADRAKLDGINERLDGVKTLQGLYDLKNYLQGEVNYKQTAVAADGGSTVDSAMRGGASAARSAFLDQLQQASGVDLTDLKTKQSALISRQEALQNVQTQLLSKQAIAQEPQSWQVAAANALGGVGQVTAGPMKGLGKWVAERAFNVKPLTQPASLIRRSLDNLPAYQDAIQTPEPAASTTALQTTRQGRAVRQDSPSTAPAPSSPMLNGAQPLSLPQTAGPSMSSPNSQAPPSFDPRFAQNRTNPTQFNAPQAIPARGFVGGADGMRQVLKQLGAPEVPANFDALTPAQRMNLFKQALKNVAPRMRN